MNERHVSESTLFRALLLRLQHPFDIDSCVALRIESENGRNSPRSVDIRRIDSDSCQHVQKKVKDRPYESQQLFQ